MINERLRLLQTSLEAPPFNGGAFPLNSIILPPDSGNFGFLTARPEVVNERAVAPPTFIAFENSGPQTDPFVPNTYTQSSAAAYLTLPPTQPENSPDVEKKDPGSPNTHRKTRR